MAAVGLATQQHQRLPVLRARAATLARQDPAYYGDACVALGPALLERSIDLCSKG
jgi:hypothetical protein